MKLCRKFGNKGDSACVGNLSKAEIQLQSDGSEVLQTDRTSSSDRFLMNIETLGVYFTAKCDEPFLEKNLMLKGETVHGRNCKKKYIYIYGS
jgi:hypothetical protein